MAEVGIGLMEFDTRDHSVGLRTILPLKEGCYLLGFLKSQYSLFPILNIKLYFYLFMLYIICFCPLCFVQILRPKLRRVWF